MDGGSVTVAVRAQPVSETRVVDVRAVHARNLWDSGWGRMRYLSFVSYLANIPRVPPRPVDKRFSRLVLVDTLFPLTDACRVLGIDYGGDDKVFSLYPSSQPDADIYWIWVQDGGVMCGRTPHDCRASFAANEVGLSAIEGVCLYASHPEILRSHSVDLPGSRLCSFPAYVASLMLVESMPTLGVAEYCSADPGRGSASRLK